MLSLPDNHWLCDVYSDRIILLRGEKIVAETLMSTETSFADALEKLFSGQRTGLPWFETLSFRLDVSQVRYLTVPWQEGILCLEDMCGYAMSLALVQWPMLSGEEKIEFVSVDYGSTALAVIIDAELWQLLLETAKRHKMRPRGIYSPLQYLLQPWTKVMPENALFCVRGEKSGIYLLYREGHWQQVWSLNNDANCDASGQLELVARIMGLSPDVPRYYLNTDNWLVTEHKVNHS